MPYQKYAGSLIKSVILIMQEFCVTLLAIKYYHEIRGALTVTSGPRIGSTWWILHS